MSLNEIVILLVIALIIFGPDDLPDIARALGKVVFEVKKIFGDMTKEFQDTVNAPKNVLNDMTKEFQNTVNAPKNALKKTLDDTLSPTPAKSTTSNTQQEETVESEEVAEETTPEEEFLTYDEEDDPLKELPEDMVSFEKSGVSR